MADGIRLTQATVSQATCPAGKKDRLIFDRDLPGFGLRVQANGAKFFIAQFTIGGIRRRKPIGAFGVVTAEEARRAARAVLGDVAKGLDPVAEQRAKDIARRDAEIAAKAKAIADHFTFEDLIDRWTAARAGDARPRYLAEASATLKRHLLSMLPLPASSIATAEIVHALDRIKDKGAPVAANRVLSYARAACGWALKRRYISVNPFIGLDAPSAERSRERVLTVHELAEIWTAAGTLAVPYGAFVRVLMLTLARRDEVAGMRWDELSPDMNIWTMPGHRTKNGVQHVVHLAKPVKDALSGTPRMVGGSYVFAAGTGRPISAYSAAKRSIIASIGDARRKEMIDPVEIGDWRFHDFRRAGVTRLADMGFPPHVADRLLNHLTGSLKGVALVYQRSQFLPERKTALDAWAATILASVEGKAAGDNIVKFRGGVA